MLDDPRKLDDTKLIDLGRHTSEGEVAADGAIKSRDMKGGDGRVNSPKTTNTLCLALTMSGLSRGEFLIASKPYAMMIRCRLGKPKPPQ